MALYSAIAIAGDPGKMSYPLIFLIV